jgi:hypothetical protein
MTSELIALAKLRLAENLLPQDAYRLAWGGLSIGRDCDLCGHWIAKGDAEIEVGWNLEKALEIFFHPACHVAMLTALSLVPPATD